MTSPAPPPARLPPEEAARADLYAVLARLFYAAPDAALLAQLAAAPGAAPDSPVAQAWQALRGAALALGADEIRAEYEDTFIGTGRARVSLYGTHYLSETWREQTLAQLRGRLAALGLQRTAEAAEPEDHLSGLLDVMQLLIRRDAGEDGVATQAEFFATYLGPWHARLCAEIVACDLRFYRVAADLLRAFLDLEQEGFAVEG